MEVFNLPPQNKTLKQIIADLDSVMDRNPDPILANCINALTELVEKDDAKH